MDGNFSGLGVAGVSLEMVPNLNFLIAQGQKKMAVSDNSSGV
jgi:hypothetical protein